MVSSVSSRVSTDGVDGDNIGKRRSASTACMTAAHSYKVSQLQNIRNFVIAESRSFIQNIIKMLAIIVIL